MNQHPKSHGGKPWLRRSLLLLLVAAAAVLALCRPRATVSPSPAETPAPQTASERDAREDAYQQDLEALNALLQNTSTDESARQQAQTQLMSMVAAHQAELGIEEALTQAGYAPCLVLCQNGALTVMLQRDTLTASDSAAILSLCAAHTDIGVENIRIMTR